MAQQHSLAHALLLLYCALHMEVTRELLVDHSQTKIKHFTVANSAMIILKVMPYKLCILFDNTHTFNPAVVDLSI